MSEIPLIREMGYVAIRTTKLHDSVRVQTELFGLRETMRSGDTSYLAAADVHHELVYIGSDEDAVDHLGLVASSPAALAELRRRVMDAGFDLISQEPLLDGIEDGFAFVGPEGFVYSIYRGMAHSPRMPGFGPDRYGHINLHPQDLASTRRFFVDVLGFMVSDIIGDDFAVFLRCNPDHHGVALISGRGSLHHHAWQTQSIADLGKLGDRLDLAGQRLIWGPVRHGAGHNIAAYFVEPSGAVVELYTDLEQIYDDERPPILWGSDDRRWFNRWGVYNGEDFRSHGLFPAAEFAR